MVLEKTLESPLDCKEIQPVHSEGDQPWDFFGRTDAKAETPVLLTISCKELTHWKRLWCWEGLEVGGEGEDRGWDGWMASPTRCTWVWVNSGSWWWIGRPGLLWFRGSQRVGHQRMIIDSTYRENAELSEFQYLSVVKNRGSLNWGLGADWGLSLLPIFRELSNGPTSHWHELLEKHSLLLTWKSKEKMWFAL